MSDPAMVSPALGLIFILGLRHGLDPDHVAVIDNIAFRMVEVRPRLAPWTGSMFAIGHSLSVAIVAIGVSLIAGLFAIPAWVGIVMDWLVMALLLLVGTLNLNALRRGDYRPTGWRSGLIPASLRASTHPLSIVAIGIIFGLVFDTATQAATWGVAASTMGGLAAASAVAAVFAVGMVLTDTIDSQIVSRLLLAGGRNGAIVRYRRGVGWLIVILSFGMAADAFAGIIGRNIDLGAHGETMIGAAAAALVIGVLWIGQAGRATAPAEW